ncbi:hypothetical protein KSP40_PGU019207 [Platanthera guangdongensis]|uniref:Uncharacterized protein n=1 Tax=Platanthera guangdongensis TaxID=2320717 RepID=A0ABR2M0J5_9ASPA
MRLPIGLHRVAFGALVALPLLLTVLSEKVLFDSGEVAQGSGWLMVDAGRLRAEIHPPANFFTGFLLQLPRQIVPPPVKLQVLLSLESFVAHLAHESICRHKCFG